MRHRNDDGGQGGRGRALLRVMQNPSFQSKGADSYLSRTKSTSATCEATGTTRLARISLATASGLDAESLQRRQHPGLDGESLYFSDRLPEEI